MFDGPEKAPPSSDLHGRIVRALGPWHGSLPPAPPGRRWTFRMDVEPGEGGMATARVTASLAATYSFPEDT